MRLSARLSDDEARQLEELRAVTGATASEVVRHAIRRLHEKTMGGRVEPSKALQATGFIGCASADPNLSATHEDALRTDLVRKHGHRCDGALARAGKPA